MKKLMHYKRRTEFFFFLAFIIFLQACQKETLLPSKGANGLTIAEAKNYFEANFKLTKANNGQIMSGEKISSAISLQKSGNTATVLFVAKNVSGWESATRFIKASGGNTAIIDNKPRGTGLNLGGNFGQDIQWTETIVWYIALSNKINNSLTLKRIT